MKILNLTQHVATPDQIAAGVIEPSAEQKAEIARLLTFDEQPTSEQVVDRARSLAYIARDSGCEAAMVGGAPYLMAPIERALKLSGVIPLYAYSVRRSVEEHQLDGSVRKSQVFAHVGFVEATRI